MDSPLQAVFMGAKAYVIGITLARDTQARGDFRFEILSGQMQFPTVVRLWGGIG